MVLGDWSRKDTLYGGEGFSIIGNGDLAEQLEARHRPASQISGRSSRKPNKPNPPPAFTPPPPERHIAEGSFFVGDDKVIHQVEDGQARARHLWRHAAQSRRHHDRQAAGRPGRAARPRPPRAPVAERRLARGEPHRRPPRPEPGLRPVRLRLRPDQQDHLLRNRRRHRHPPHAQPRQIPRGPGRHAGHGPRRLRRGDGKSRQSPDPAAGRGRQEPARHARHLRRGRTAGVASTARAASTWRISRSSTASPRTPSSPNWAT